MINRTVLVGRLTKDPEQRMTASNVVVVTFTLAVNRSFTDQSGERQADFISCVAWRRQGEFLAKFAKKGSLIGVDGRIQTRSYESETGTRYITEVVVDSLNILESKDTTLSRGSSDPKIQQQVAVEEEADNDAYYETSKALAADDDLPF